MEIDVIVEKIPQCVMADMPIHLGLYSSIGPSQLNFFIGAGSKGDR